MLIMFVKGELLRQQLLVRYCGGSQPFDLDSDESRYTRHGTSASDSDRGSLQLGRDKSLHEVQAC